MANRCNARKNGKLGKLDAGEWAGLGYCKAIAGAGTDHLRSGRCKHHGGLSAQGPASGTWLHGKYAVSVASKLPPALRAIYVEGLDDPELVAGRADITLDNVYLQELTEEVERGESLEGFREIAVHASAILRADALEKAQARANGILRIVDQRRNFHNTFQRIMQVTEHKRRLQKTEQERLIQLEQMLRLKDLDGIIEFLVKTVHEALDQLGEQEQADAVLDHLAKSLAKRADIAHLKALSA